jgi:hypothetical protein
MCRDTVRRAAERWKSMIRRQNEKFCSTMALYRVFCSPMSASTSDRLRPSISIGNSDCEIVHQLSSLRSCGLSARWARKPCMRGAVAHVAGTGQPPGLLAQQRLHLAPRNGVPATAQPKKINQ